jgi:hypothetical protein
MVEKGEAAKGDENHIERSGVHLGFQDRALACSGGIRLLGYCCANLRNPSHVGRLFPTCKIGNSL